MQGPLDPVMYDTNRQPESWWRASAPDWADPPPLAGELETDVAIIGGGYAGLSCARRLAEHGIEASVLDAGPIGWGASGRNGGIVGMSSHKASDAALIRRYGADEVARMDTLQRDGVDRLAAFCKDHVVPVQGTGELILAHSEKAFKTLRTEHPAEGVTHEVVDPANTGDMRRFGGILIKPGFGVHPLQLVRALADAAIATGQQVFPRTEILRWHREGGRHRLETARGTVVADRVVVATNGFAPDGLHPRIDGRAVPVISNIGVTRVLTNEERARHPWLANDPVADTKNLLVYLRMLPEGRLLFGMRGDLRGSATGAGKMRGHLIRRVGEQFPGWADIPVEFFWRGPICATARYTPSIGQLPDDPSVSHAFGWHGSGVNGAQVGGRMLADVIAGAPEDTVPSPYRGLAPRLPMPGLRPLYVGFALAQQRLADVFS